MTTDTTTKRPPPDAVDRHTGEKLRVLGQLTTVNLIVETAERNLRAWPAARVARLVTR